MPSYNSSYTGLQIDESVSKYFEAKASGGIVNANTLTTTLSNYLLGTTAASTYLTKTDAASIYQPLIATGNSGQFYRGDKTWSSTLNGQEFIVNSTDDEQVIEMRKNGVKKNQLDSSTNSYILWSNKTASAGTLSWQKSIEIDRASNTCTIYGRLNTLNPEFTIVDEGYIMTNCAAYVTTASSVTGTLKITLPLSNGHTVMQMLEVWVYDYSSMAGSQLIISGYTYVNKDWYNYACKTQGNYNRGCRMAFDGSKFCILLGTTSTTWSYPQIYIAKYFGGFSSRAHIHDGQPTISFIASESGYTITGSAT